ncbi:MAG: crossover junction endodeoxyribonuclease RuvC [Candidatus Omnitrophota bacterium]|nr:MAG: crossover junction endodeoxyribonuclease RuvC [Candidatus Omnitrophota bacterium]
MRVLGVDPGLNCTGYGVVEQNQQNQKIILTTGVVKTSSKLSMSIRLNKIYTVLKEIIKIYSPDVLALEQIYSHYKNPSTAILMAHARGVICLLGSAKMPVIGYAAKRVKQAVTGTGGATKLQIQKTVKQIFNLNDIPEPNDIADALALALTHIDIAKKNFLYSSLNKKR